MRELPAIIHVARFDRITLLAVLTLSDALFVRVTTTCCVLAILFLFGLIDCGLAAAPFPLGLSIIRGSVCVFHSLHGQSPPRSGLRQWVFYEPWHNVVAFQRQRA